MQYRGRSFDPTSGGSRGAQRGGGHHHRGGGRGNDAHSTGGYYVAHFRRPEVATDNSRIALSKQDYDRRVMEIAVGAFDVQSALAAFRAKYRLAEPEGGSGGSVSPPPPPLPAGLAAPSTAMTVTTQSSGALTAVAQPATSSQAAASSSSTGGASWIFSRRSAASRQQQPPPKVGSLFAFDPSEPAASTPLATVSQDPLEVNRNAIDVLKIPDPATVGLTASAAQQRPVALAAAIVDDGRFREHRYLHAPEDVQRLGLQELGKGVGAAT
jgi:hypothetical protein